MGPGIGPGEGVERFAALYPGLRRFAAAVGPESVDPDDLVQEALVRVLGRGGLDGIADAAAYLRTVIVRLSSNERRSLGRRRRALSRLAVDVATRADDRVGGEIVDLTELSAKDRAILYLTIIEGRTYADAATILGGAEGALRARASRALRRLRSELYEVENDG